MTFLKVNDLQAFGEAIDNMLSDLGNLFDADRSYLYRFSQDLSVCSNTHEWCRAGVPPQKDKLQRQPTGVFPWWMTQMSRRQPLHIPDVAMLSEEAANEKAALQTLGIRSLLTVPFGDEHSRLLGFMGFDTVRAPHAWTDEQIGLIVVLAEIIGSAISRMETMAALAASEEKYRALAESSPEMIYLIDEQGFVKYLNPTAAAMFPGGAAAVAGKHLSELYLPEFAKRHLQAIRAVISSGKTFSSELLERFPGQDRWIDARLSPVRNREGKITEVLGLSQDITERKRAEQALNEKIQFIASLLRAIPVAVFYKDSQGRYLGCNDTFTEIMGVTSEQIKGKTVHELWPGELAEKYHQMDLELMRRREHQTYEFKVKAKDGKIHPVIFAKDFFLDSAGKVAGLVGAFLDISDRKRAEEEQAKLQAQLMQAQKMESIGRLAGGVAHDFNNMLGVILGHAELALERLEPDHPLRESLQEIRQAAERSADLTRQLLAFARKQTVTLRVLDLNDKVAGTLQMLRRLIGEDIDLAWRPGADLWRVAIDPAQVDQVLANLCVNARDAIADTGKVTIETNNVTLSAEYCADHPGISPGEYVMLAVSDDGCGMDAETRSHLFEPFFTTKEVGKGTGLGLATVYGIVRQNDGFINVYSEPGQGTTFKIYLPRHTEKAKAMPEPRQAPTPAPSAGGETILVVEDEPSFRTLCQRMLEGLGYTVIPAATPGEAIRLAREHEGQIDLLITDVVMPEMNGRDLAKNLMSIYPAIRRLFMSGYTANVIAHHGVLDEGVHFLQKPFTQNELAAKVQEALENE
ncbi:MAG: PAS domain S-box protein [Myxococcales bacterium]|nr:PAS domain S-box protein [Myxococcales bacterium]